MEWMLLDPLRDQDRLRAFLSDADPGDYLLEGLSEWIGDGRLWAGVDQGVWVAFGRFHDLGSGDGWVSGIRVHPSHRRRGVGRELVETIRADARRSGVRTLRAVIEDPNVASRALFTRSGFDPVLDLTLRCGSPRPSEDTLLRPARPEEGIGGPVGWLAASAGVVGLLPGSDGGRFGAWRPSLVAEWQREGRLHVGSGLAAVVQPDWWESPRTLWVEPLRGEPSALFPELDRLTGRLDHEQWQAFLPSSERLRAEYGALGTRPHPFWGDRVQLYEWKESTPIGRGR